MDYLKPAFDAPAPTQSAVIAPMSVAEPMIGEHRHRFDAAAAWGVPAHVTILYPFAEPVALDDKVIATLAKAVASVSAFDCRFAGTRWFGDDVLWLAPEPTEPFHQLTSAVWDAFPHYPPYGGDHDDVVPHLTIAERRICDLSTMQAVEQAVLPGLPLSGRVDRVLLIAGAPAPKSWRVLHELALGAPATLKF